MVVLRLVVWLELRVVKVLVGVVLLLNLTLPRRLKVLLRLVVVCWTTSPVHLRVVRPRLKVWSRKRWPVLPIFLSCV